MSFKTGGEPTNSEQTLTSEGKHLSSLALRKQYKVPLQCRPPKPRPPRKADPYTHVSPPLYVEMETLGPGDVFVGICSLFIMCLYVFVVYLFIYHVFVGIFSLSINSLTAMDE